MELKLDDNTTSIILNLITLCGVVFTGWLGYLNRKGIAEVKDGLQTKMIEAKQGEAAALGTAQGIAKERDRQAAAAPPGVDRRAPARPPIGTTPTGTPEDPVAVVEVKQ